MFSSVKEYLVALGKWVFVIAALLLGDVLGIIQSANTAFLLPQWGWWIILVIILTISPFLVFHKLRYERDELQRKLDDIKNARPNISYYDTQIETTPLSALMPALGRVVIGKPVIARVRFMNKPESCVQGIDAPDLAAQISFYAQDNEQLFPTMVGRWANTKHQSQGALPNEVAQITLHPNGIPEPLLIALKYTDNESAHGLNVDNEKFSDWRDSSKQIPVGEWRLKVHLQGINVDKEFWFVLKNKGIDKDLEVTPL